MRIFNKTKIAPGIWIYGQEMEVVDEEEFEFTLIVSLFGELFEWAGLYADEDAVSEAINDLEEDFDELYTSQRAEAYREWGKTYKPDTTTTITRTVYTPRPKGLGSIVLLVLAWVGICFIAWHLAIWLYT